jgi:Ca-activated chloride channel family protein
MVELPLPYEWFNYHWLEFAFLRNLEWEHPERLWLIALIPIIWGLRWFLSLSFRQYMRSFWGGGLKPATIFPFLYRLIQPLLFSAFMVMLCISMAGPMQGKGGIPQRKSGLSLFILLDISESMSISDIKPSRLQYAQNMILELIKQRPQDKISLILFSAESYTLVPLTNDHKIVAEQLKQLNTLSLQRDGTSIGNALGTALNRINRAKVEAGHILLISDGENTTGALDPEMVAVFCKRQNIHIFSVGLGTEGWVPLGLDQNGQVRYVESHLDEALLKRISRNTKGQYYRHSQKDWITSLTEALNELPTETMAVGKAEAPQRVYRIYLYWGLIFLLVWIWSKLSFINNFLED